MNHYSASADETISYWRDNKLTPFDAWYALTGERRNYANWGMVEDFMVGWLQGEQRRSAQRIKEVA